MQEIGKPFTPIHPGELLKDELEYRKITQKKIANKLGISYAILNETLNCKRPITVELALILEAILEIDARLLLRMQTSYNIQVAEKDKKIIDKINKIKQIAFV